MTPAKSQAGDHKIVWAEFHPPHESSPDPHAPKTGNAVREVLWNGAHIGAYIFEVQIGGRTPQYPKGLKYKAVSMLRKAFRPASFPTAEAALSYMEKQHHALNETPPQKYEPDPWRILPKNNRGGEPPTGGKTLHSLKKWQKFYHASPVRFRHGDILTGGHEGGYGIRGQQVYMTTTPVPHGTIQSSIPGSKYFNPDREILKNQPVTNLRFKDWYVYEVEPLGSVHYSSGNGEYLTDSARVLKNLGKALPLLEKSYQKNESGMGWGAVALNPAKERKRLEEMEKRRMNEPSAKRIAARFYDSSCITGSEHHPSEIKLMNRNDLIKLAVKLPQGSEERRAVLAMIEREASTVDSAMQAVNDSIAKGR